jgi:hypothetical protein
MFSWIVSHPLAYPALEVLHIVGIALLLGNLALFELRVWGFGGELPVLALARMALSLSLAGKHQMSANPASRPNCWPTAPSSSRWGW